MCIKSSQCINIFDGAIYEKLNWIWRLMNLRLQYILLKKKNPLRIYTRAHTHTDSVDTDDHSCQRAVLPCEYIQEYVLCVHASFFLFSPISSKLGATVTPSTCQKFLKCCRVFSRLGRLFFFLCNNVCRILLWNTAAEFTTPITHTHWNKWSRADTNTQTHKHTHTHTHIYIHTGTFWFSKKPNIFDRWHITFYHKCLFSHPFSKCALNSEWQKI